MDELENEGSACDNALTTGKEISSNDAMCECNVNVECEDKV